MPQDLIGCRKREKLKALIPRVVVFVNDPSSVERRIDLLSFLLFYGLTNSEVLDKKYCIAVQGIFSVHRLVV